MEKTEESNLMVQIKEIKDTQDEQCKILEQHSQILEQHGEKIDKILSIVLTQQGQIAIMQGQIAIMQGQIDSMPEQIDKKIDEKFEQLKKEIGPLLKGVYDEAEARITKNEKDIQSLPCINFKGKLKKLVSKPN